MRDSPTGRETTFTERGDAGEHRFHLRRRLELVGDDPPRNRLRGVVLREERFEHRVGIASRGVLRKEAAIAQVAPAANHGERHAPHVVALDHHGDVGIGPTGGLRRLAREDALQDTDLVAVQGGLLVLQRLGRRVHLRGEIGNDVVLVALEELRGMIDVAVVGLGPDPPHARRRAAPDLVQQAGT